MKYKARKTSRPVAAFLIGLVGTAAALLIHDLGLDRRGELYMLDLMFESFSTAKDAGRIVHVDIDDRSRDEVGRRPWPRQTLAGVIDVLAECGAQIIVMDLILPHPQEPRYVGEADQVYGVIHRGAIVHDVPPVRIFDDAILAETIARNGNVFAAMHVDLGRDGLSDLQARVLANVLTYPDASPEKILAGDAGLSGACDAETFDKTYLRMRALAAMRRFGLPLKETGGMSIPSGTMVPPLVTFAGAARGSGFVTSVDDPDGVVRRTPLLARSSGKLHMQLALAVAVGEISRAHCGGAPPEKIISIGRNKLTISCEDGFERSIPVDKDGMMQINWLRSREGGPPHISCAGVARVFQLRQDAERNRRLARVTQLQIARELNQADLLTLFADADELHRRRVGAERARYVASLYEPGKIPAAPSEMIAAEAAIEAKIERAAAELRKELDEFYLAKRPEAPEALGKYNRLVALRDRLDEIREANERIAGDLALQMHRVRRHVAGKICLLGSIATADADFVPTPVGAQTPGVVVLSNIANTILTGSFITRAHLALDVAAILAVGALVSLAAAFRPVLQAAALSLLAAFGYAAFNGVVVFGAWSTWLTAVGPLGAMVLSLFFVTAFRQLTEERAKRHIRAMFSRALSPDLVERLLADPSLAQLGGQKRALSCMFSDLAGFTPISERLGPQKTVRLLNRYFDRVTDVVQNRGGGYLNKFLGDGILCFFGAPVFQEDHAAKAIRAAVECQAAVAGLNEELRGEFGGEVRLSARIGVATGEAMVGNCGSTDRMDYTAIGDCVNLAARLEEANKFFGTVVLVSDETWRLGGGSGFLARPLGEVLVAGQRGAVRVWNVLGSAGGAPGGLTDALADFARAVGLFGERRSAEACELLEKVSKAVPDDRPSKIFLDLCRECASAPPGEKWQPACETGDGTVRIALPGGGD